MRTGEWGIGRGEYGKLKNISIVLSIGLFLTRYGCQKHIFCISHSRALIKEMFAVTKNYSNYLASEVVILGFVLGLLPPDGTVKGILVSTGVPLISPLMSKT